MNWKRKIDRESPIPLYHQLQLLLMNDVVSGALTPGEMLPSELEMCESLALSRTTVRQALNAMVNDGYLVRRKGKGTFVSAPKLEANFIQKLESFHTEMQSRGIHPSTRVLKLELTPGIAGANEKLGIDASQPLVALERLCFGDDIPIYYQQSYLPAVRFADLVREDLTAHSLYNLLNARFGTRVTHVRRQIEAIGATQSMAELLGIARGDAVCRVENLASDQDGWPVEYNISFYRGDRSKFSMDLYSESPFPRTPAP